MAKTTQKSDPALITAAELRDALGKLKRRLREEYNARDLTLSQLSLLSRLERDGPATVTSLAKAEGMRPQSLGATVATLETAGLVKGSPDPTDGRQTMITITALTRKKFSEARSAKEDWLFRTIKEKLSKEEQKQLVTAVLLLKKLADD